VRKVKSVSRVIAEITLDSGQKRLIGTEWTNETLNPSSHWGPYADLKNAVQDDLLKLEREWGKFDAKIVYRTEKKTTTTVTYEDISHGYIGENSWSSK